MSVLVIFLRF